jgi:hypothetical protein
MTPRVDPIRHSPQCQRCVLEERQAEEVESVLGEEVPQGDLLEQRTG